MINWQQDQDGQVPPDVLPQGHEADGTPLWVARAIIGHAYQPGKVRGAFLAANIPFDGNEVKVNPYQVLTVKGTWVQAQGGQVPANAYVAGYDVGGEELYIALAPYNGGLHPGKVRPAFGAANIGYGGAEVKVYEYQVLVDD